VACWWAHSRQWCPPGATGARCAEHRSATRLEPQDKQICAVKARGQGSGEESSRIVVGRSLAADRDGAACQRCRACSTEISVAYAAVLQAHRAAWTALLCLRHGE
jgi:hypothetical protein